MKLRLLVILSLLLASCGTKKKLNDNAVHLYNNQLQFIDGAYYNYGVNKLNQTSLLEELGMESQPEVELINLRWLASNEQFEVSFHSQHQFETRFISGKHKNGGFRFYKTRNWFGIPLLLYTSRKKTKHIYLGNDNNLVIEIAEHSDQSFFFKSKSTDLKTTNYYDKSF